MSSTPTPSEVNQFCKDLANNCEIQCPTCTNSLKYGAKARSNGKHKNLFFCSSCSDNYRISQVINDLKNKGRYYSLWKEYQVGYEYQEGYE